MFIAIGTNEAVTYGDLLLILVGVALLLLILFLLRRT